LNLGRHFSVDQDLWASLCVRIEQLMSHQAELLPIELTATVEKAAQRIAAQLIARQAVVIKTPVADEGHSAPVESVAPEEAVAPVDLQAVDADSLELFAGNVSEAGTLETMLQNLGAPQDVLVVMDAGIATEANIQWLRTTGYGIESDVGKATQSPLSLWERVRVRVLQRSLYQLWLLYVLNME